MAIFLAYLASRAENVEYALHKIGRPNPTTPTHFESVAERNAYDDMQHSRALRGRGVSL
ncbi:hypothetical protein D3C85_1827440 [compost metagenome]